MAVSIYSVINTNTKKFCRKHTCNHSIVTYDLNINTRGIYCFKLYKMYFTKVER
jgi:hypothetical protein